MFLFLVFLYIKHLVISDLKKKSLHTLFILSTILFLVIPNIGYSQFYTGSSMRFGKNRVQHEDFTWFYRKYDRYNIYYYEGGAEASLFASDIVYEVLDELSNRFEYYYEDEDRVNIIIYNKLEDFRQNNIGLNEESDNNIGGTTRIYGRNIFIYFDGNHQHFETNIREGVSRIMAQQKIFGDTWLEILKNSTLLTVPEWYMDGLISYFSKPYNLIEPRISDAVSYKKFNAFNRMDESEKLIFGHAMWNYVAEIYGEKLIPNILYMSRVGRSIESGFLFVLGISFKELKKEMLQHYERKYSIEPDKPNMQENTVSLKTKKHRHYHNIRFSPDEQYLAYIETKLGRSKVYIYNRSTKKKKKIFVFGPRLERIQDFSYPLIEWHPKGEILSIVYPKKFETKIKYHSLVSKEKVEKTIFGIDKVTSFSYAPDGKKIILSAISEGKSDLFLYTISSNTSTRLTDDIYDDLTPVFLNSNEILFASNRTNDSLEKNLKQEKEFFQDNFDLYALTISGDNKYKLTRFTQTTQNEMQPLALTKNEFSYLSDYSGITSRFKAYRDSAVSHVDTTIHYRYFINSVVESNYHVPIHEFHTSKEHNYTSEILYFKGKYHMFIIDEKNRSKKLIHTKTNKILIDTNAVFNLGGKEKNLPNNPKIYFQEYPKIELSKPNIISTEKYLFSSETSANNTTQGIVNNSVSNSFTDTNTVKVREKVIPSSRFYYHSFTASDITSKVDFDFANQLYQHFNGGPYVQPGMGIVLKVDVKDLFEDYKLEGGIRMGLNGNSTEYFASLEDRSKRWDKLYSIQRQTLNFSSDFFNAKTTTYLLKVRYSFPFSEVSSIRITPSIRRDAGVILSTDAFTLPVPSIYETWGGIKLEYIFDDSRAKGLNLYHGTKFKLFAEHYRVVNDVNTDIYITGWDYRHALKIHRDLIWVNRFSAGFSFGTRKLVHYLGSVDNWIYISENPRFDTGTPIAQDAGYYFQTIVPPLRGFIQNARNGNNFALINSELRFPVFKYFIAKPLKSEFLQNFQLIGFGDIGTAWTGLHPYSEDNSFNTKTIVDGNLTITIKNQTDPIAAGVGWGLRTTLFGYFIRIDRAWGIENATFKQPRFYFSLGLDF